MVCQYESPRGDTVLVIGLEPYQHLGSKIDNIIGSFDFRRDLFMGKYIKSVFCSPPSSQVFLGLPIDS